MPFCQDVMDKQKTVLMYSNIKNNIEDNFPDKNIDNIQLPILNDLKVLDCPYKDHPKGNRSNNYLSKFASNTSTLTIVSNKCSMSTFRKSKYCWETCTSINSLPCQFTDNVSKSGIFGKKEIAVFMTLSDDFCRNRTLSTQATASINKCFQVSNEWLSHTPNTNVTCTENSSCCTTSTLPYYGHKQVMRDKLVDTNIYFFGTKKDQRKQKGMGTKSSHTTLQKTSQTSTHAIKSDKSSSKLSVKSTSNESMRGSAGYKPKPNCTSQVATSMGTKSVTIKDEKQLKPCPALGGITKGDMMVTVSHIKIGPKETCPVHGNDPCQGPKCILASSGAEQGPVKVTTVNNPRRGVFEIVIRKLTGAPLAKNELMLEWTPPPSRPTCSGTYATPCYLPGTCRPSKCKLIICRPSPCKPKCCKIKPCGRIRCRVTPCKSCSKCCRKPCGNPCKPPIPCNSCNPCNPCNQCSRCKPCPSPVCCSPASSSPSCAPSRSTCTSPCRSSPCLRPCPVGHKRHRKSRSQPRIRRHPKKVSPCFNRSKTCPIVRCRSVPNPCIGCCSVSPFCSVSRCRPPKICPSTCSS